MTNPTMTLTTTAGQVDYLGFIYTTLASAWGALAVNKGFAS